MDEFCELGGFGDDALPMAVSFYLSTAGFIIFGIFVSWIVSGPARRREALQRGNSIFAMTADALQGLAETAAVLLLVIAAGTLLLGHSLQSYWVAALFLLVAAMSWVTGKLCQDLLEARR